MNICGNIKLCFFFPSYPVSTGFSLAWLLALTKSSVLLVSVVGLFYTDDFFVAVIDCKFVATG